MARLGDDELVRVARRGDRRAFIDLVRRHEQPLAALIAREVSDVHHREDVLQETLLQAWLGLATLREPERAKAWLIAIARNRCRDFRKSAKRREQPTDGAAMEVYVNRAGRAVRDATPADEVRQAVHAVPATQRRAAEMFYLAGLTIAEIARRLQQPPGTIKSRLYHAREALRRTMSK